MKLRSWAPLSLGEAAILDDGSLEIEHKVLVYGTQAQRDHKGKMREFSVTPELAAEMVANCQRDLATNFLSPIFVGHPDDRSTAPAVGWVKGLRAADDGLYATVRYLPEMAARIVSEEYRYVSPTFTFEYEDQRGKEAGAKLLDIGVLNTPHQKDIGPILADVAFTLSEVASRDEDDSIRHETPAEDQHMQDETKLQELAASVDAKLAEMEKRLTEAIGKATAKPADEEKPFAAMSESQDKLAGAVIALGKRLDATEKALSEKAAEYGKTAAEVVALREEAAGYKVALAETRIKSLVQDGIDNGTLEPADVPGFGTDKFDPCKWLSESKFNGEKGLRTHVATAKPVVSLSERRRSAPSAGIESKGDTIDLDSMPFDEKLFGSRDEFKKFALASASR